MNIIGAIVGGIQYQLVKEEKAAERRQFQKTTTEITDLDQKIEQELEEYLDHTEKATDQK